MHDTQVYLQRLTTTDLQKLKFFCEARLAKCGLPALHAEDIVSKALNSVIRGLEPGQVGRRPRPDELATPGDFMDFLRGAVYSTVDAHCRQREFRHYHHAIDAKDSFQMAAVASQDLENELLDLKAVMFARLRAEAPPRLRQTIRHWEEVFMWSDAIPNVPNAKYAYDVRQMARTIMEELGMAPAQRQLRAA